MCPCLLNVSCIILFHNLEIKVGQNTLNACNYLNGVYTLNVFFCGYFCHFMTKLMSISHVLCGYFSWAGVAVFIYDSQYSREANVLALVTRNLFLLLLFFVKALYFFNFFQFY